MESIGPRSRDKTTIILPEVEQKNQNNMKRPSLALRTQVLKKEIFVFLCPRLQELTVGRLVVKK